MTDQRQTCWFGTVIPAKAGTSIRMFMAGKWTTPKENRCSPSPSNLPFPPAISCAALEDDHPCARLHGHNYIVEVELKGQTLDARGFVRDYRELAPLKHLIDDEFDHRHLNDVLGHDHPTAEQLALFFYDWAHDRWPEVSAVRVSETPKTWAEYRP